MLRRRISPAVPCAAAAVLLASTAARAQSLDQQVTRLLDNNCLEIGFPAGTNNPAFIGLIGPNLDQICLDNNAQPDGSSTGGGGALSQASDALLARQRSEGRLEELREGAAKKVLEAADLFDVAGLGLWISGDYTRRDREVTFFEDGYESHVTGATGGVDYRVGDLLVMGLAYNYQNVDARFTGGGGFDTDSHGGVLYGSLTPIAGLYADGSLGYAWKDYEVDRPVSFTEVQQNNPGIITLQHTGVAKSDTDGGELSAKAVFGYDWSFEAVTVGPHAGVNFVHTTVDGYAEKGTTGIELVYRERTRQSLQSLLGATLSAASSMGFGVLIPQIDVEWVHEYQDDQRHHSVHFVEDLRPQPGVFSFENEAPDRDYFNLNAGVSLALAHGVQLYAQYRTLLGNEDFDSQGISAGVRVELGSGD
jgi:outer membrane autotransporter protein